MGEFIAIHPFREGNGRTAFILGNLILMQNDLLPLDVYDRLGETRAATSKPAKRPEYRRTMCPWPRSSVSGKTPRSSRWETGNGGD